VQQQQHQQQQQHANRKGELSEEAKNTHCERTVHFLLIFFFALPLVMSE
jgi:hypothetical protein